MRQALLFRVNAVILGLLAVIVSGCIGSSTPASFYTLSPLKTESTVKQDTSREPSVIVTIGPIRIPDYLDRSQIVTRSGKNELKLAEFERWAGPLESDVVRVLIEDVSALLPRDRFFVTRWSPPLEVQVHPRYLVEAILVRFEGTLGGSVALRAQWGIFDKDRHLLAKRDSSFTEQVQGNDYGALVDAMSRAVAGLSQEMAKAIKSLSEEAK